MLDETLPGYCDSKLAGPAEELSQNPLDRPIHVSRIPEHVHSEVDFVANPAIELAILVNPSKWFHLTSPRLVYSETRLHKSPDKLTKNSNHP